MAIVYSLLCENGSSGTYWGGLTASEKLRYGPSGSERVYSGLTAWHSDRKNNTSMSYYEVCEIGEAFTDSSDQLNINLPCGGGRITPTVNGVLTSAYHYGIRGNGYIFQRVGSSTGGGDGSLRLTAYRFLVEGLNINVLYSASYGNGGLSNSNGSLVQNCFIYKSGGVSGIGYVNAGASVLFNCIIEDFSTGLFFNRYMGGSRVLNCLTTKNDIGVAYQYDSNSISDDINNVISIGNSTSNWPSYIPSGLHNASNNGGASGDVIAYTGANSSLVLTTSDFTDFSNGDFTPKSTSPVVGAGIEIYGLDNVDIAGDVRPSYNPSGEENWDVGPLEYDHGNGLAPQIVPLEISNIIEGSAVTLEKIDGTVIINPVVVGASQKIIEEYTYVEDADVVLKVRKSSAGTKYKALTMLGQITEHGLNMFISQQVDEVLN